MAERPHMARPKKAVSDSRSTTIQVRRDLKDKLDLLKILLQKEDLHSVIGEILDFYVANKKIGVDEGIADFLKRLKK